MACVSIDGDNLVVSIAGIRKLGTFRSEIIVPLTNVRGATADPTIATRWPGFKKVREWPGRKILGTDAYGYYLGGTFSQDGDRVFWDVRNPENAIVISLEGDDFARLIVEVEHPEQTVREIEAAVQKA